MASNYQTGNRGDVLAEETVLVTPPTSFDGFRVAWSGVWTGLLVVIGVLLLLTTLGLAIGISNAHIGPNQDLNAGALGKGAAIWSGIAFLIALFLGGLVATRTGVVYDKTSSVVEGALVWVLSLLAIIYLASSGVGMLAGTVSGALGGITQTAKTAVGSVDVSGLTSGDVDQIVARLNSPDTARAVAAATDMTQAEAQSTLGGIARKVEAVRADPAQAAAQAKQGMQELASRAATVTQTAAAKVQPYATAAVWSSLAVMVLSLLAAIFGAMIGRVEIRHRLAGPDRTSASGPAR